jgi:hypothetical protein
MAKDVGAQLWPLYASHRERLTATIVDARPKGGGRLCLLGAGACNDVDLEQLAPAWSEIHLVDIDAAALNQAVARQPLAVRARLRCHAPVDLSGMSPRFLTWKKKPPTFTEVETAATATAAALVAKLPGPFDLVVSTCVLTQMSFHLNDALGAGHLMLGKIRQALIETHLVTLMNLTATGGTSLFVSDLVSSNAYPLADLPAGRDLRAVMADAIDRGAFYFAANPTLIRRLLRRAPALAGRGAEPELLEPWLWTGAFERTYLVYALRWRRLPADAAATAPSGGASSRSSDGK